MPRKQVIIGAVAAGVLALPAAADRIAASVVEHRLASRLQCAAGLETAPDVHLGGFPALTQLASQSLDEIRVQARDVALPKITVGRLEAEAEHVSLTGGSVGAGAVTVDATIPYDEFSGLAGLGSGKKKGSGEDNGSGFEDGGPSDTASGSPSDAASGSDGGAESGGVPGTGGGGKRGGLTAGDMRVVGADDAQRLVLQAEVTVRGLRLPATVYADVALTGDRLTVTPVEVELSSVGLRLPASRLPAAASQARTVDLPALPGGLAYRSVTPAADGLRVVAGGTDLRLEPNGKIKSDKTCGGTA
ncbi:MAG: DUF2993 domain-containing protein [Actinomycetota bacterium]|nr:DUF2993 domain-containing protein [Actinomycetota bacterium]